MGREPKNTVGIEGQDPISPAAVDQHLQLLRILTKPSQDPKHGCPNAHRGERRADPGPQISATINRQRARLRISVVLMAIWQVCWRSCGKREQQRKLVDSDSTSSSPIGLSILCKVVFRCASARLVKRLQVGGLLVPSTIGGCRNGNHGSHGF